MRFNIGQVIFGVAFVNPNAKMSTLHPLMFDEVQPEKIIFQKLLVTEHHKVNWTYDTNCKEPSYDGYILTADPDLSFTNQFPHADYEQTSSAADYIFRYNPKQGENIKALVNNTKNVPYEFKHMGVLLEELLCAIDAFKKNTRNTSMPLSMQTLLDRIKEEFSKAYPEQTIIIEKEVVSESYNHYRVKFISK